MKNYVSKETFKNYLGNCPKVAWALSNIQNFKKAAELQKNKKYIFKIDKNVEEEDSFNNSRAFNNLEYYLYLLEKNELSLEEFENKKKFMSIFSDDGLIDDQFAGSSIEDGNLVGELARQLFIKKNLIQNQKNNEEKRCESLELISNMNDAMAKTKAYLNDENVRYLFEPAFIAMNGNLRTRCDILVNNGNNHVEIVEVKATTSIKQEHFLDLYYQKKILEMCGFIVDQVSLCIISKMYWKGAIVDNDIEIEKYKYEDFENELEELIDSELEYNGIDDDIDIDKLLVIYSTYEKSKSSKNIIEILNNIDTLMDFETYVENISQYLDNPILNSETCNKIAINSQIDKKTWVGMSEEKYCHHVLEWFDDKKLNVFDLGFRNKSLSAEIKIKYGKIYLDDFDIDKLIAQDNKFDVQKPKFQMQVIKRWLENKPFSIFNPKSISDIKNMIYKWYSKYPIYMYDFETSIWAIPKFNKSKSYQQIPFQYSLDIICEKNWSHDSKIVHTQFLAKERKDPREMLIKQMIKDMFLKGPGIYVAYNYSFEKSVIKSLIAAYPKYEKPLAFIYNNTIDLMNFFSMASKNLMNTSKESTWIYHPNFKKSYSIKYTQPALYPELSYDDLYINKGTKASESFRMYIDEFTSQEEWDESIYNNMLKYCNRDTMAMIVLLEAILKSLEKFEKEGYTHNV
ncbi:DUF2779 domain-containing protein [Spiroplasma endosymbiont of Crioceris asparagi]|uniref:DUF2779 domain-containing protein n=1 Tax=Spiroplasma endosymbiont of Crioceris asparagi TaxID=3066286 RepID=UPI0030CF2EC6